MDQTITENRLKDFETVFFGENKTNEKVALGYIYLIKKAGGIIARKPEKLNKVVIVDIDHRTIDTAHKTAAYQSEVSGNLVILTTSLFMSSFDNKRKNNPILSKDDFRNDERYCHLIKRENIKILSLPIDKDSLKRLITEFVS